MGNVGRSSWTRWKARSRLPISVNWISFARCYGWGATSDYRLKIGNFAPTGPGWPKISGRRGRPPPTIFLLVWYKNLDRSFFRFITIHACDRRTDRQTEFSSLYRVCIACSAVKIVPELTYNVLSGTLSLYSTMTLMAFLNCLQINIRICTQVWLMIRDHSFPRAAAFRAELRNLAIAA